MEPDLSNDNHLDMNLLRVFINKTSCILRRRTITSHRVTQNTKCQHVKDTTRVPPHKFITVWLGESSQS